MHYFYEFQCLVESNFRSHILHSLVFSQSSLLEILSDTEIIEVLETAHLPSCRQVTTAEVVTGFFGSFGPGIMPTRMILSHL